MKRTLYGLTLVAAALSPMLPGAADAKATAEEIARLAYHYWQARGCPGGSPEEDWFRAEHDLRRGRSAEAGA